MFEDRTELTTIEAIVRVSRGGLISADIGELEFRESVLAFLGGSNDVGRAIGIVMMAAEMLGLVTRDPEGRWETRERAAPHVEAGPEGHRSSAAEEAARVVMPSGPAPADVSARRKAKQDIFSEVFSFEVAGRPVGELHYSELDRIESQTKRDARIVRRIRQHAVPTTDQTVAEYFPASKLQKIIREESNRASQH